MNTRRVAATYHNNRNGGSIVGLRSQRKICGNDKFTLLSLGTV